jgi:hypothetical protein
MSGQAGLHYAFTRVHRGEGAVVAQLQKIAERHSSDHEVHHVAHDLAGWSRENLQQVSAVAAHHAIELDSAPADPGRLDHLRQALSTLVSRRPEPGLLLLEDLRDTYLLASETSLAWELLAQHAQAAHEDDILELASRCHPQTLRQIRWCNTMLKTLSPQTLTSL